MPAPPREVLRCMTRMKRLVSEAPADDLRALRNTRGVVTIMLSKFVDEDAVRADAIDLGFSAEWASPATGRRSIVRLVHTRWSREMDSWDANHWAWLYALAVNQASDVLPLFQAATGPCVGFKPSYKLSPTNLGCAPRCS